MSNIGGPGADNRDASSSPCPKPLRWIFYPLRAGRTNSPVAVAPHPAGLFAYFPGDVLVREEESLEHGAQLGAEALDIVAELAHIVGEDLDFLG
ncbi:MAG TPA: hypothetical protein VFO16_14670 [Pseudonocardiaceae bacterium]|nr:hypothetical protein [Pseudonocardiaceae bacterium]